MDTKIKNHQVTAHSPSTLDKIKKVGIGQKLADIEKTFGSRIFNKLSAKIFILFKNFIYALSMDKIYFHLLYFLKLKFGKNLHLKILVKQKVRRV